MLDAISDKRVIDATPIDEYQLDEPLPQPQGIAGKIAHRIRGVVNVLKPPKPVDLQKLRQALVPILSNLNVEKYHITLEEAGDPERPYFKVMARGKESNVGKAREHEDSHLEKMLLFEIHFVNDQCMIFIPGVRNARDFDGLNLKYFVDQHGFEKQRKENRLYGKKDEKLSEAGSTQLYSFPAERLGKEMPLILKKFQAIFEAANEDQNV